MNSLLDQEERERPTYENISLQDIVSILVSSDIGETQQSKSQIIGNFHTLYTKLVLGKSPQGVCDFPLELVFC